MPVWCSTLLMKHLIHVYVHVIACVNNILSTLTMLPAPQVLTMAPGLTQLEIIPFHVAGYNKKTQPMDLCDPEQKDDFLCISGTQIRPRTPHTEQDLCSAMHGAKVYTCIAVESCF